MLVYIIYCIVAEICDAEAFGRRYPQEHPVVDDCLVGLCMAILRFGVGLHYVVGRRVYESAVFSGNEHLAVRTAADVSYDHEPFHFRMSVAKKTDVSCFRIEQSHSSIY